MRFTSFIVITVSLTAGCSPARQPSGNEAPEPPVAVPGEMAGWRLQDFTKSTELTFAPRGAPVMSLSCAKDAGTLSVNLPAFRPVGSEERLSFGGNGKVLTLVANSAGDTDRGGVTGTGEIPYELKGYLVGRTISASYGTQASGPHPAPHYELARDFLRACHEAATAARIAASRPNSSTHPCQVQDGRLLDNSPIKAVGTEPFWAAKIEGRCVTYSTPEDQKGTRIWTRIHDGPDGGIWVGAYKGKPFSLVPTPSAGCSDGMSDKVYPMEVDLRVEGERRRGCAEKL